MNANTILFVLVMIAAIIVLFICAYVSRDKDDMTKKRSRAIGLFITLVMNTIYSSYVLGKNLKFSPTYVVFISELSQILFVSLVWRIYKLIDRKRQPAVNRSEGELTERSETMA